MTRLTQLLSFISNLYRMLVTLYSLRYRQETVVVLANDLRC